MEPQHIRGIPQLARHTENIAVRLFLLLASAATISSGFNCNGAGTPEVELAGGRPASTQYLNTLPGVSYVGSSACAGCHKQVYENYIHSDMAQALSLPTKQRLESLHIPIPATVFDKTLNRYFKVFIDASGLCQTVYWFDKNGKTLHQETEKVKYLMGTGKNGIGSVVQRGSYLFQAPLAFYTRSKSWELSPGYESYDFAFSRPITAECIACHSGLPQPIPNRVGLYKNPPVLELGIGCENCHGPGGLHVAQRQKAVPIKGIDRTIVNPDRLPAWLADNICMFCHQQGDLRVLRPARNILDFRPGTPLDNTVSIFRVLSRHNPTGENPIVDYHLEMESSKCYRASGGRLSCTTCHNPHFQPPASEAAAYYSKRCMICHEQNSSSPPIHRELHLNGQNNCVSCHLPKQAAARQFAHTVITNHRMLTGSEEPYPEFGLPLDDSRMLVHVDSVPGEGPSSIPAVILFQVYSQLLLADPNTPRYRERYDELLNQLIRTEPGNVVVLVGLAGKEAEKETPIATEQAVRYLQRAINLGPINPNYRILLARELAMSGRPSEAIQQLKTAISLEPYNPMYYEALATYYLLIGRHQDAINFVGSALRIFPENANLLLLSDEATNPSPADRK